VTSSATSRRRRILDIEQAIDDRSLLWFGVRGTDAAPLLPIRQFAACFSIISPLTTASSLHQLSLETLKHARVDLNAYSTDTDDSKEVDFLFDELLTACERPTVLVTYRPAAMLAAVYYSRLTTVSYFGLFHEQEAAFEHKAWVEHQLAREGIPVLPWHYVSASDWDTLVTNLRDAPFVVRANRSSGGLGFTLVHTLEEAQRVRPMARFGFFAVAPYLVPNIPLNVSACVFPDGGITLHNPSVQLIGIPACTTRPFAYCGNDFAQVQLLEPHILSEFEQMTIRTGTWLHRMGYVGAFGVDALWYDGRLYLCEVNPRFQGTSAMSADLAARMDIPDVFLDHLSAFFGWSAPKGVPLWDQAKMQPRAAQVVCYNKLDRGITRVSPLQTFEDGVVGLPELGVHVEADAMLYKLVETGPVTSDGANLTSSVESKLERVTAVQFGEVHKGHKPEG